jgi:hypothetical protein
MTCILQGSGVSLPWFLTLRGLENSRAHLCTPTSAHILVVAFPSSSWRLKKRGKANKKMKEKTMGSTSLTVLYSRYLEMPYHQSLGMPQVGVLQLPSRVLPRAGTACAYLSLFLSTIELNRLPGKFGGEPCMCGTVRVPINIQLVLWL